MKAELLVLLSSYRQTILTAPHQDEYINAEEFSGSKWHLELMDSYPQNEYDERSLALTMIKDMEIMLEEEGVTDKFNRWLGFLQGVMWCSELRTINEMRDENRPIFRGSASPTESTE